MRSSPTSLDSAHVAHGDGHPHDGGFIHSNTDKKTETVPLQLRMNCCLGREGGFEVPLLHVQMKSAPFAYPPFYYCVCVIRLMIKSLCPGAMSSPGIP